MFRETESASVCHADKFFRKMIDSSGKRLPRYLDIYRDRWQVENNVSAAFQPPDYLLFFDKTAKHICIQKRSYLSFL